MTTPSPEQNTEVALHTKMSMAVLDRINTEKVGLSPRWQFILSEYGIWILWVLSVLFGAVAFSVMLFVFMHAGFAFHEATHTTVIDFYVEVLPYLWIIVFILMAVLAHFYLRHTKYGYKYTLSEIVGSSLLFSFIGGIALHVVGVGYFVDVQTGRNIPSYPTVERMETKLWQAPQQGRMIGSLQRGAERGAPALFTDSNGAQWTLSTTELNPMDLDLLYSGEPVRLLGVVSTTSASYFHGCGVFPWGFTKRGSFEEMKKERTAFIEKMNEHHGKVARMRTASGTPVVSVCASHTTVIRLSPYFKEQQ